MTSQKEITIPVTEYVRLLKAEIRINLLECGGVDNWSYYGDALNPEGEQGIEELEKEIEDKYL